MRRKKRIRKKKFMLLIFILFIIAISGLIYYKYFNNNELIPVINKEDNKFIGIDGYDKKNLQKYLEYLNKNDNAPLEDIILLVNNGIDNSYSKELVSLVKAKYFIKNNLDAYLKYEEKDIDKKVAAVNVGLNNEYYTHMKATDLSKKDLIIVNKYYYLDSDYEPDDLEVIDSNYSQGVNNRLCHSARVAFEEMAAAAALDNIKLFNVSAYRSYQTQENIYNRNVANKGVEETDKASARPGNSEHQSGLALDVNWINTEFEDTPAFKWLQNNAHKYGFILRYLKNKEDLTGYIYEPWHYRYVGKEVASKIKEEGITFDEYYAYYLS